MGRNRHKNTIFRVGGSFRIRKRNIEKFHAGENFLSRNRHIKNLV